MPPWSQSLALAWQPDLEFFELRTEFLRELQDQDHLVAFRWLSDAISARIGRSELVELRSNGARFVQAVEDQEAGLCEDTLRRAIELLRPDDIRITHAGLRFIIPLDGDYDATRVVTARRLLAAMLPGEPSITDWAVLVDGYSPTVGSEYQVEFGIINDAEAFQRVTGNIGRVLQVPGGPIDAPEDFWRIEEAPPCALFLEFSWHGVAGRGTLTGWDDVLKHWRQVADESERLAGRVHGQVEQALQDDTSEVASQ